MFTASGEVMAAFGKPYGEFHQEQLPVAQVPERSITEGIHALLHHDIPPFLPANEFCSN